MSKETHKGKNYNIFDKHKYNELELQNAVNNGLLSPIINSIITYKKEDGYYYKRNLSEPIFKSFGIKESFIQSSNFDDESFFLTDFHLICIGGKLLSKKYIGSKNNQKIVYDCKDNVKVIPLNIVEYIQIDYGRNSNGSWAPKIREIQKNPIKGAAIGAVIAGVPGAAIGAAFNSGTKKTLVGGGSYNNDYYTLRIKIKNEPEYVCEEFYKIKVISQTDKNKFEIKNENAKSIIKNAKQKRTIEEKKNIVNETIMNGKTQAYKIKKENTIVIILLIIVFIVLVILLDSFC